MASLRELLDDSVRLYGKGDIDGLVEMYAEDAVFTIPGFRCEGKDQIRHYWAALYRAFPDGASEVGRYAESGDMLFAEIVSTGTNTGELTLPDGTTLPPTGKTTNNPGMLFARVQDEKIVEEDIYFDSLSLMSQLGLL